MRVNQGMEMKEFHHMNSQLLLIVPDRKCHCLLQMSETFRCHFQRDLKCKCCTSATLSTWVNILFTRSSVAIVQRGVVTQPLGSIQQFSSGKNVCIVLYYNGLLLQIGTKYNVQTISTRLRDKSILKSLRIDLAGYCVQSGDTGRVFSNDKIFCFFTIKHSFEYIFMHRIH